MDVNQLKNESEQIILDLPVILGVAPNGRNIVSELAVRGDMAVIDILIYLYHVNTGSGVFSR